MVSSFYANGVTYGDDPADPPVPSDGSFQYSIDNGVNWQASPIFPNLKGNGVVYYPVWVKDGANTIGGTSQSLSTLGGAAPLTTATDATCANNDGALHVEPNGGNPPFTFKIDKGSYGSPATSADFTGLVSGDHTVFVMDVNGCEGSDVVNVPLNNTLVLTMGGDATICEGDKATLRATSPNGVSFSWTPATGLSNPTALQPVANPQTTTTYTLTATWAGCTQTGTETVNVNPAPVADAGPGETTCYGKDVVLKGGGMGTGPLSYRWRPTTFLSSSTTSGPTVVTPTATTTYTLKVTDGNGCTSLNDASVTVKVTPPPQVFAGNDTNVVAGQPVPLHATDVSNTGFTDYSWAPAAGLSSGTGQDVVVVAAGETTSYVVTATTAQGCLGVDSVTVKVFDEADLYVPSAFSPNHDGHNDVLRVVGPSIRALKVFAVYDRYGGQVFTTSNLAVGWDGTRDGRALPPGVYVWMAVGVDFAGKVVERKGTVVLVR
jgi:gliding motility-associated-like protein